MPKMLWIIVVVAVVLTASISLSSENSTTALIMQRSAIVAAIVLPVGWVAMDLLGKPWQAWRRLTSRPY